MSQNYSFQTSMPAYLDQPFTKRKQADEVLRFIKKGANNLLQISNLSGIPQAIVSARVNDLIDEERAKYEGCIIFNNRKRKRIVAIKPEIKITQTELFN